MEPNKSQPGSEAPAGHKLTQKQWVVVTAVAVTAASAGPIVAAFAALGTAGGCYASNKLGWSEG